MNSERSCESVQHITNGRNGEQPSGVHRGGFDGQQPGQGLMHPHQSAVPSQLNPQAEAFQPHQTQQIGHMPPPPVFPSPNVAFVSSPPNIMVSKAGPSMSMWLV